MEEYKKSICEINKVKKILLPEYNIANNSENSCKVKVFKTKEQVNYATNILTETSTIFLLLFSIITQPHDYIIISNAATMD